VVWAISPSLKLMPSHAVSTAIRCLAPWRPRSGSCAQRPSRHIHDENSIRWHPRMPLMFSRDAIAPAPPPAQLGAIVPA